jgi:hypothetical protein
MNGINIIHQAGRRNDAPKKDNRSYKYKRDFIVQPGTPLPEHRDLDRRLVLRLRDFFHRRNIAIPLSYLLRHRQLVETILRAIRKCGVRLPALACEAAGSVGLELLNDCGPFPTWKL